MQIISTEVITDDCPLPVGGLGPRLLYYCPLAIVLPRLRACNVP